MVCCRWVWLICAVAVITAPAGCGRPSLPGQQFQGERVQTASGPPASPLPEQPYLEWGPPDAKVRVVAYYPIDDDHRRLMDLLKSLAEQYPGKAYVKYVDYRTREGQAMFQRSELKAPGLLINAQNSIEIRGEPYSHTVDFAQEMGRFWTADDLKAAVAQEVEKAYGKGTAVK